MFCLHPKEVDTARGERPRGANSWVKVLARVILGNIIFCITSIKIISN